MQPIWSLGLMSGTSLDGIDAALIRTDGITVTERGPWQTTPLAPAMRDDLRGLMQGRGDALAIEKEFTLLHADVVASLLKIAGMRPRDIGLIGFHGQTITHRPAEGITWQLGNGALLAERTGISVVADFRRRDVAAGGQGAPLVPLFHAAMAYSLPMPVAVLNIGGIANISWVARSESEGENILSHDIIAFDTGPGNVLLNELAEHQTGQPYDKDGGLALSGRADLALVARLLEDEYFRLSPPKSLDRGYFTLAPVAHLSPPAAAATLVEFTAAAIAQGVSFFPAPVKQWLVSGGGRLNPAIMAALSRRLDNLSPVESVGWEGDALEAQAFAFLGVRSLYRLPLSLPTTTGANHEVTGGAFYPV